MTAGTESGTGTGTGSGAGGSEAAGTGTTRACLVDVWQTILGGDYRARVRHLADHAGVDVDTWLAAWLGIAVERDRGTMSVADSFAVTLRACGVEPKPDLVADLMRLDVETMRAYVRLYDDAVPFFTGLRDRGIAVALVSNCSETTRPLLEYLDVIRLTDAVVLSCEVRSAKPSPDIYLAALEDLGVAAVDAVFIDDQPTFCAGAEAVGVRAIQIARPDIAGPAPSPAFPLVTTLLDAPRYF
jgi:putative hydrolase of the HAD superfamily